jgi:VanZ family protein
MVIFQFISKIVSLLYCGVILFLSHQPNLSPPISGGQVDKIYHFMEYGLFSALFFVGWHFFRVKSGLFYLFLMLFAASDEFHQSFIPNRSASVWDFVVDVFAGILCYNGMKLLMGVRDRK